MIDVRMVRDQLIILAVLIVKCLAGGPQGARVSKSLVVARMNLTWERVYDVAAKYDLQLLSKVFPDEDYYLLKSTNKSISPKLIQQMRQDAQILAVLPQHLKDRKGRKISNGKIRYDKGGDIPEININHQLYHRVNKTVDAKIKFNDPFYTDQWYLYNYGQTGSPIGNDINVLPAWIAGYTGHGVTLSVLDDGIQHDNEEIRQNYNSGVSFDYIDNEADVDEEPLDNSHGTYCAAIIAAVANNNICGVGVAYDAKVGGTRLIDGPVTDVQEALALTHALNKIDIFSASWGPGDDGRQVDGPSTLAQKAFIKGVTQGRNGKGVIYVWAAGNGGEDYDNCNLDGYVSNIHSISVGALTADGQNTYYSEPCAAVLASTYIGGSHAKPIRQNYAQYLTDIKVVVPNIQGECVESFQGTSAAAPMAAGIIALVLQANNKLTWRDVQHLVVRTSRIPSTLPVPGGWTMNEAGYHFNMYQGFGVMDAAHMVSLAKRWTNVPPSSSIANSSSQLPKNFHGKDVSSLKIIINPMEASPGNKVRSVEHVSITLTLLHPHRGQIQFYLKSPSGTVSTLLTRRKYDDSSQGLHHWQFTSIHFWGEDPTGTWTLLIQDFSQPSFEIRRITECDLKIFGTEEIMPKFKLIENLKGKLTSREVRQLFETELKYSKNLRIKKFSASEDKFKLNSNIIKLLQMLKLQNTFDAKRENINKTILSLNFRFLDLFNQYYDNMQSLDRLKSNILQRNQSNFLKRNLKPILQQLNYLYDLKIQRDIREKWPKIPIMQKTYPD